MAAELEIRHILNANPAYARSDLGPLDSLTKSIEAHGIRVPLLIKPDFFLIDGARRLVVAKRLGLKTVPVRMIQTWDELLKYFKPAESSCLPMNWPDLIEYWYTSLEPIYRQIRTFNTVQSRRRGTTEKKPLYSKFIIDLATLYKTTPSAIKMTRDYVKRLQSKQEIYPYFCTEVLARLPTGEAARDLTQSKYIKMTIENVVNGRFTQEKGITVFTRRLSGELYISSSHNGRGGTPPAAAPDRSALVRSFNEVNTLADMIENLATESEAFRNFDLTRPEGEKVLARIKSAVSTITRMRRRLELHTLGEKEEV